MVDSLTRELLNAKEDTTRAFLMVTLSEELYLSNIDTLWSMCRNAISILSKLPKEIRELKSMKNVYSSALNNLGAYFNYKGKIDEALYYYKEALKIKKKIDDKPGVASILNNLGVIYNDIGQIQEALNYYHRSLIIREEIKDMEGQATSLNNIGYISNAQGDITEAIDYFGRALKINEALNNKHGVAYGLNNLGALYQKQGKIQEALDKFHRSLRIKEEIKDKQGISATLLNIGMIYKEHGKTAKALEFLNRSLSLRREVQDLSGIAYALSNIGMTHLEFSKKENEIFNKTYWVRKAKLYGDSALVISRRAGYPENIRDAANLLTLVFEQQEKGMEALNMHRLYIKMRDSIKNTENKKAAYKKQFQYEFEKKQLIKEQDEKEQQRTKQEKALRRNHLQYSFIATGLLIASLLVTLLVRYQIPVKIMEGSIFVVFLVFFEFILVLTDPYTDSWTGGEPVWKLLLNAFFAMIIFPLHQFFEKALKKWLQKNKRLKNLRACKEITFTSP